LGYLTKILTERKIFIVLLLGFSSGLPLALFESTLRTWFSTTNVSTQSIGLLTLVSFPCVLKFLWAPLMDRYSLPFLGRRRGWILCTQLLIGIVLCVMAFCNPSLNPMTLSVLACALAFCSASQDIAIDAYRTEVLSEQERALGAAMGVNGYRIGMLVSGGLALVFADRQGWTLTYLLMAALMFMCVFATLLGPEPAFSTPAPKNLKEATWSAVQDFFNRKQALSLLLLILTYKVGDAFVSSLIQTFLIREVHMSVESIGYLVKVLGFVATLLGTVLGALLINRLGYYWSLMLFGIAQATSNLTYMALLWVQDKYIMLTAGSAIFIENLCYGMATSAFLSLLMSLCNKKFTAFQFAILTALSACARVFTGPYAAKIEASYGWHGFFITSLLLSLPGLLLLQILKGRLDKIFAQSNSTA